MTKEEKLKAEIERTELMYMYEDSCTEEYVAGIDEVGRGPFFGPVVACAVILPKDERILYLNDSKKLSEKKREELYSVIMEKALAVGIGVVSEKVIDEINILQATYEAMRNAVASLSIKPLVTLNDAVIIPGLGEDIKQVKIIKGDAKSASIAAASIVAKVTRDHMISEMSLQYPEYDLANNKGYGTKKHIEALKKYGPTEHHRMSFIKKFI